MIPRKGSQSAIRKAHQACSNAIMSNIMSDERKKEVYMQKQEKIADNRDRLLKYISELRTKYSGDTLVYLEENVFKKWAAIKYRRDASLAHHDVENALQSYYSM